MTIKISNGNLVGKIEVPSSKSLLHRYLILSALSDRPTKLKFFNTSKDITATKSCLISLGAKIEDTSDGCIVYPVEKVETVPVLDADESASTIRFLTPVSTALYGKVVLSANGSLKERPQYISHLKELSFSGTDYPVTVSGRLKGGEYVLSGADSSQPISGLLMALPLTDGGTVKITDGFSSKPYADMTAECMKNFGVKVEREQDLYKVNKAPYISSGEYKIDGDWSSAAVFYLANKLGGKVEIGNLCKDGQADRRILKYLDLIFYGDAEFDLKENPDLAPVIAVGACFTNSTVKLKNVGRLKFKESDRISALTENINKLGGNAVADENSLTVIGTGKLKGGTTVDSYFDHRIAIAMAIAGVYAEKPIEIVNAQAVEKSYPEFFSDLKKLKGKIYVY